MSEVQQLLQQYAEHGSEAAFRELVDRYVGLVYSSALRLVGGDAHLAQDVTQCVFLQLSRNAPKLANAHFLGGWLHRNTCNIASNLLRSERRRQARERQAALMDSTPSTLHQLAPVLDEVINQLPTQDRTAILLRFFEQQDYRSIAAATGSTEDATRMRVHRALDKLRSMLQRRGLTITATALAATLTTHAVNAAPVGLALSIAAKVIASPLDIGGVTLPKLLIMTQAKTATLSAILAAALAIPLVFNYLDASNLRNANLALTRRAGTLSQLAADTQRPASARPPTLSIPPDQLDDLLRLRNQVGMQSDELKNLRARLAAQRAQTAAQQQALQSYFPRETWASAGTATPQEALQHFLHLMVTQKDLNSFLEKLSPEEQESLRKGAADYPEEKLKTEFAEASETLSTLHGIRFITTEPLTNNRIRVIYLQLKPQATNDLRTVGWNAVELQHGPSGWGIPH